MADVRPFRAITYALRGDVTPLTAPPYDVIGPEQRSELLARDAHNVVALELPEGPSDPEEPGNRYQVARARWESWLSTGVLAEDPSPAIFVLEQRYSLGPRRVRRRGFVAAVGLEPFSAGVILPHERTLPKALSDRLEMLRATGANLSPVFGLFSDPERATERVMDEAQAADPMLVATDDDGVESRVWPIRDREATTAVVTALAGEKVFIADGHHRYTVALAHRDERRAQPSDAATLTGHAEARDGTPDAPRHDFVMMMLANMDDPELVVLPTHRVADAPAGWDPDDFWRSLEDRFDLFLPPEEEETALLDTADRPAFVVATRDGRRRLAVVRDGWREAIAGNRSDAWKDLDVAVVQELVLDPLLGIHPDRPETLERLSFVKDAQEAARLTGRRDVAFLMRATRMDQLRSVALAGETMPQKSTYFYPKLLSGLLFRAAG